MKTIDKNKILDYLEDKSLNNLFSGSVLLAQNKNILLEFTSGFANRELQTPNSIDTLFNIGSLDKMFTAVAIAQLVEAGKISFKDKMIEYLPNFASKPGNNITIEQILTHTEGFPSYFNRRYIDRYKELYTVTDYVKLFQNEPLHFEPGAKYQYSNSGFVILGAIIESITGISYYDYVKEHVFNVVEMNNTGSFHPDNNNRVARGYTKRLKFSQRLGDDFRDVTEELPLKGSPAGGGYSTCYDLLNFFTALRDNKLLPSEIKETLLIPRISIDSKKDICLGYGYGFQIYTKNNEIISYGHAGASAGVSARCDYYPDIDVSVIVLSNIDPPAASAVAYDIGLAFS